MCGDIVLIQPPVGRREGERAAIGHGVAGIEGQVEQGIFKLAGVDDGLGQVLSQHGVHLDGFAKGAPQQVGHPPHQLVQVDRFRLQGLAPREGQQAVDKGRPPVHRDQRPLYQGPQLRPLGESFIQQLEVAQDDRQQVVKVVGNSTRQLPYRFHLLRLPQPLLGDFALGDVARHDDNDRLVHARRLHGRGPRFEKALSGFCYPQLVLGDLGLPGAKGLPDDVQHVFGKLCRHYVADQPALERSGIRIEQFGL